MRKLYLLLALAMAANLPALAGNDDTFNFVKADGTVVPDGSVVNVSEPYVDEDFGDYYIPSGLYLKNISGKEVGVKLYLTPVALPSGSFQICCMGDCQASAGAQSKSGVYAKDYKEDLMLEWIPAKSTDYGTATATITTAVCEVKGTTALNKRAGDKIADGPTITVNFVNPDPSGIESVENPSNGVVKVVARYNAAGQKISKPEKGINILKLANGRTVKQLIK